MGKLVTLLSIICAVSAAVDADIFDNDSEFMRGFETGLFLRSKGGDVNEYGCTEPQSMTGNASKKAIDTIKNSIEMAKGALSLDPLIDQSLDMVIEFMEGLLTFRAPSFSSKSPTT